MILARVELRSFAVVPRYDTAEALFSLNNAFIGWNEIGTKNLVSDIYSLMRPFVVVIRQPFMVTMIKMFQAKTNEVIKALFLNDADAGCTGCIPIDKYQGCGVPLIIR